MATATVEIQMPQMGESVTEGTVLEWHKQEGDFVDEGETVVEVSTDKVDAEVPAPASGKLTKQLKAEDETVHVGEALAELDPSAAPSEDGASAEGNGAAPEAEAPEAEEPAPEAAEEPAAEEPAAAGTEQPSDEAQAIEEGQTVQLVM